MAAPYHNLRSKLNRAVKAWLVAQDCGTDASIHVGFTVHDREFPLTTVRATVGTPQHPHTGNYSIRVMITVKGAAAQSTGNKPDISRATFDSRLALTFDALMQSDDEQTLRFTAKSITSAGRALASAADATRLSNTDMADFTILQWLEAGFGEPEAEDDGCDWAETIMFDSVCCPSNVGGYSLTD